MYRLTITTIITSNAMDNDQWKMPERQRKRTNNNNNKTMNKFFHVHQKWKRIYDYYYKTWTQLEQKQKCRNCWCSFVPIEREALFFRIFRNEIRKNCDRIDASEHGTTFVRTNSAVWNSFGKNERWKNKWREINYTHSTFVDLFHILIHTMYYVWCGYIVYMLDGICALCQTTTIL